MDQSQRGTPPASAERTPGTTIALCAIAKDEAAYLPEWVLYHRWWGFDRIHVMLNGITDNSVTIMEKLAASLDGVTYETVDHLNTPAASEADRALLRPSFLKLNPMQARSYAQAYARAGDRGWDYLFFADIDEFFFDRSGKQVLDVLRDLGSPDVFYLRWFNCAGDRDEFCQLARNRLWGRYMRVEKFFVRTGLSPVEFFSPHKVTLPAGARQCDSKLTTVLLHRCYRSRLEYLALLGRGDTIVNGDTWLKLNRSGWWARGPLSFSMNRVLVAEIRQFIQNGIRECGIEHDLAIAQTHVRSRAEKVIQEFDRVRRLNARMSPLVRGTGITLFPSLRAWLHDGVRRLLGKLGVW
jgi:hypothetical protein